MSNDNGQPWVESEYPGRDKYGRPWDGYVTHYKCKECGHGALSRRDAEEHQKQAHPPEPEREER